MEPLGDGRLTRTLARDVPPATRAKGTDYYLDGAVVEITGGASAVKATVRGTLPYHVTIERKGKTFSISCECPYFLDRGTVCKHIWAVMLEAERGGLLDDDGPSRFCNRRRDCVQVQRDDCAHINHFGGDTECL